MQVAEVLKLYRNSTQDKPTWYTDKYIDTKLSALWGDIEHFEFSVIQLNQYKNKRLLEVKIGTVRRELSQYRRGQSN